MDATQVISDSILESDEEETEEQTRNKESRPVAKLCILKNPHIPETELPLFLGDNVLGRDPSTSTLPFPAPSVSKQHATICISVYKRRGCCSDVHIEALVWDLGSMNGTRKGRLKLTPNVRYALSEGDSLVVADIPCQYVSCSEDSVSSQDDIRTPGSKKAGGKVRLADASGEGQGDTSTSNKKCFSGSAKARVASKRTPVKGSCLSFEDTPTQHQGSLVPESDSDSDSGTGGKGDKNRKILVSDCQKSRLNSSVFLSPANKIVPESEDESLMTPSSSSRNGSSRHVSFSIEETDADVSQQQPDTKKSPVVMGHPLKEKQTEANSSRQHVSLRSNVSLTGESPMSVSEASKDAIPAFHMDSDTDVEEGEEEEALSAGHQGSEAKQKQTDPPPNTALFHMDSDTTDDEDCSDKVPKIIPSSDDSPKVTSVPEGIVMDSDTDMEDDTATTTKATSLLNAHTADAASSVQLRDFHLESDTDVDEEEEGDCLTLNKNSKKEEKPMDAKLTVPEPAPVPPPGLRPDTDTSHKAATNSCAAADVGADLDILSDSDTDVEDDSALVKPVAVPTLPACSTGSTSEALKSDSDAKTDEDKPSVPLTGDGGNPADLRVDSDTDVEEEEDRILVPFLQNCSTPVQMSEGDVENMETQAFISPSCVTFRSAGLSSCSDSQEDDFLVAETQSFILQHRDVQMGTCLPKASAVDSSGSEREKPGGRGGSLQVGLSDSRNLRALATESTQAFASVEGGVNLEDTQAYAAVSTADRTAAENESNLEATLAYGEDEEMGGDSETSEKDVSVDLPLEATQSYITEPNSDPEEDPDEDKKQSAAQPSGSPLSSTLAVAETLPASSYEVEHGLESTNPDCSVQKVKTDAQMDTDEREKHGEAAQTQERSLTMDQPVTDTQPLPPSDSEDGHEEDSFPGQPNRKPREGQSQPLAPLAETQPMVVCEEHASDEDDSEIIHHRRKAKPLKPEEEQSQPLAPLAETQPMVICEEDTGDEDYSEITHHRRKAKPLQPEEEQSQPLASLAETQPLVICEEDTGDEDDSEIIHHRRKAKPLQPEEEQSQPLASSEMSGGQTPSQLKGDDEDSLPGPRKRKAKQLHLEDEETQRLTNTELSPAGIPPQAVGDEDSEATTGQRKRKAKPRQPEQPEVSAVETQPLGVCEGEREDGERLNPHPRKRKAKALQPEEEQTQPILSSETSGVETRSELKGGDTNNEDEDSVSVPQKRRAKRLHLEEGETPPPIHSKVCAAETPVESKTSGSRVTRAGLREAEECSLAQRRQSRRESKALPSTRGRGGKAKSDDDEDQMKSVRKTRGRKNTNQQVDDESDENKSSAEKTQMKDKKEEKQKETDAAERRQQEREEAEKKRREAEEEERQQAERMKLQLERAERENKEKEEREEKQKLEREEKERIERERKEQERIESLERAKRQEEERLEKEKKELQAKLQMEEREKVKKQVKSKDKEEEEKTKAPARGRRTAARATATQSTTEPGPDSVSANDDFPARRTRSRSNSSNSVGSERSASSVCTQRSDGGGRGRGAPRGSDTPRASRRRTTTAAEQNSNASCPQDPPSGPDSSTPSRGRGGRQRGRVRRTEALLDPAAPVSDLSSTGRDRKTKGSAGQALREDDKERADCRQAAASRGQQGASGSEPAAPSDDGRLNPEEELATEKSLSPQRTVRGRGQKAVKAEPAGPAAPADSEGGEVRTTRKGRNSQLEANARVDRTKANAKEEKADGAEASVQARRTSRATSSRKKPADSVPGEEGEAVEKKASGRTSLVQRSKREAPEENRPSTLSETRRSAVSRKRHPPADSSPVAKTPRSSPASPAAAGRLGAGDQAYKVLFTGVVDEEGERVLARLGGSLAEGVADMNCLVTDKVRRTVKFLCAVARGIPVVTTDWLEKSGKAGSFLSPGAFVVKDPEQEKKFSFCLQDSLRTASGRRLLQGYEIHVTKSVKPEPVHMKDIISSSGATFLPKMPSSHKPQTVVISCEEDWRLCGPAVSASLPVVTAEFILAGILQQKLDFHTHALPAPPAAPLPSGGRGRSRRKI
ncbi:mediator of DNA damage checkpoint protein 1 isoform 2-T3 [Menidia menidia]